MVMTEGLTTKTIPENPTILVYVCAVRVITALMDDMAATTV